MASKFSRIRVQCYIDTVLYKLQTPMRYNGASGPWSSASSLSPWLRESPESAPVSDTRKLSPGDENREGGVSAVIGCHMWGEPRDQYDTRHRSSSRCFPCSGTGAGPS